MRFSSCLESDISRSSASGGWEKKGPARHSCAVAQAPGQLSPAPSPATISSEQQLESGAPGCGDAPRSSIAVDRRTGWVLELQRDAAPAPASANIQPARLRIDRKLQARTTGSAENRSGAGIIACPGKRDRRVRVSHVDVVGTEIGVKDHLVAIETERRARLSPVLVFRAAVH